MNKVSKKLQKFVSVFLVLALLAPVCFSAFAADEGTITLNKTVVKNTSISETDEHGNPSQFFDVTLSQKYGETSEETSEVSPNGGKKPFDVLFVLDRSSSMKSNGNKVRLSSGGSSPLNKTVLRILLGNQIMQGTMDETNCVVANLLSCGAKISLVDFCGGNGENRKVNVVNFSNNQNIQYTKSLDLTSNVSDLFSNDKQMVKDHIVGKLKNIPDKASTNMHGGLLLAKKVAQAHQAMNPNRDLEIVLLTDGIPTAYFKNDEIFDKGGNGTTCQPEEFNAARKVGVELTNMDGVRLTVVGMFSGYDKGSDEWNIVQRLFSTEDPGEYVGESFKSVSEPACKKFYSFCKGQNDKDLNEIFGKMVKYVSRAYTVQSSIVDTVPADFQVIDSSVESLKKAGFEVTKNSDGTTTISNSNYELKNEKQSITYTIKYTGDNSGVRYTNTKATLTVLSTNQSKDYPMPVVGINPKTVNDSFEVAAGQAKSVIGNVIKNDIYSKFVPDKVLKDNGYTVGDYKIHLCDENGNEYTAPDGVSISINESTGDIEFSNSKAETLKFFYYVDATAKKENAEDISIKSRITTVTITTKANEPEQESKTEQESKPEQESVAAPETEDVLEAVDTGDSTNSVLVSIATILFISSIAASAVIISKKHEYNK